MRITAGRFKGRSIATGEGPGYRPATARVREALFNMLAARGLVWAGLRVMDVFAGSGSLGIEALSRGAAFCRFIEKNKSAAGLIRKNLADIGAERGEWAVETADAAKALAGRAGTPFGLIFVDPPYGKDLFPPTLERIVAGGWLAPEGILAAEVEDRLALDPEAAAQGLDLLADRAYGQTRILLWQRTSS